MTTHLYTASCAADGGIYHYEILKNGVGTVDIVQREFLPLECPMYMTVSENSLFCVLLEPFSGTKESGVVRVTLENGYFGKCGKPVGTRGIEGCHLCALGGSVYVANYTSGNLCRIADIWDIADKVVQHAGRGVNAARQEAPHTHCIIPSPDGMYLFAADLGTDEITVYDSELRRLSTARVPDGSGPRHLAFSGDGRRLYSVNELISGVSVFERDGASLKYKNTYSSLPEGFKGESYAAAIRVRDKRIYVSNRGDDSIAYFDENDENDENGGKEEGKGELSRVGAVKCGGRWPRDFLICEDMLFCANELSDSVTVFRLEDGIPHDTGKVLFQKRPLALASCITED